MRTHAQCNARILRAYTFRAWRDAGAPITLAMRTALARKLRARRACAPVPGG